MKSRTIIAVTALAMLATTAFFVSAFEANARRQYVPLIVLRSSEQPVNDTSFVNAITSTASPERQLYILRGGTGDVTVYKRERGSATDIRSSVHNPKALTVDSEGRMYIASESEVRVVDTTGRTITVFPVPNIVSIDTLNDRNIVVASPDSGGLLRVYSPTGQLLRRIGQLRNLDRTNAAQNAFLNRGRVAVGASDEIYYISMFASTPIVQKFSGQGQLLSEFAIEGHAVNFQREIAQAFLNTKDFGTVGGFSVITSAAVDPTTGHLWIGMNGSSNRETVSSRSGVLYEYDANGVKLAEYALMLTSNSTTDVITAVSDIAVNTPYIYVLTSERVYRFNMGNTVAVNNEDREKGL